MTTFKKLNTKIYQKSTTQITPDYIYWKQYGSPVLVKEFGPIDYIDFSPIEPHYFAVTCSVRVQVYNPITKLVTKNLSRFRENAYGASFKQDGRLICAGGEEANVKLFDVSTKSLLRLFKGHGAAVHRTFFVQDRPQIASFSDDKTVKLWDIPTEKCLHTFSNHEDYVRAGSTSPILPDIVLSGGYDSKVNMYDTRTGDVVLSVNHGDPVESLIFLPAGGIFISAGGTCLKIWDVFAGGKLLGCVSQHHKTITCLRLASGNKRLLSASLDRHVKVYDVNTYKVVHTLDYPNAVLSLGVSKNDDTIAAGMTDGLVAINRREAPKPDREKIKSFKYANVHVPTVDLAVPEVKLDKEAKYDRHLRKFEFAKALDCVLLPYVVSKNPQITVALIQELIRRRVLHKALHGRDSKSISAFLKFLRKNLTDYRFTRILIDAANIFVDTYEHNETPETQVEIAMLAKMIKEEVELLKQQAELEGAMHMLLSANVTSEISLASSYNLRPSVDAQKNLVVDLD